MGRVDWEGIDQVAAGCPPSRTAFIQLPCATRLNSRQTGICVTLERRKKKENTQRQCPCNTALIHAVVFVSCYSGPSSHILNGGIHITPMWVGCISRWFITPASSCLDCEIARGNDFILNYEFFDQIMGWRNDRSRVLRETFPTWD